MATFRPRPQERGYLLQLDGMNCGVAASRRRQNQRLTSTMDNAPATYLRIGWRPLAPSSASG
jgi:hypothetical protein